MPMSLAESREQLAIANRIVANEGVIDAFGHVSLRHPSNPQRYLLARSRAPELVEPGDIYEFDLDSQPIVTPKTRMYGERVIHGEIYKARPDVMAVCHHHSYSVLPFCITGTPLLPVFHLGATMGQTAPFWDSRDEFGDTSLLVVKPEEGASLARALGSHHMVLMRRHGATLVGPTLRELIFRTIFSARNAEMQLRSAALGIVGPLTRGEAHLAGASNLNASPLERAWEYWTARIERAGMMPARKTKPAAGAKRAAPRKVAKAKRRR